MPTIYVDDQPVSFQPGETLLRIVLRAGLNVPHYCYHPGLKITAQCRQCMVEITDMGNGRGMPRLQASCSTPAADNMRISITSDKVREGQKVINEFLLVNHPLDCPICDQAGECELQNIAFSFGSGHSEMAYEKRVYGVRDVGTFLMLERNRCVQCSRCERFSRDLVGSHDFASFQRSHEISFDTYEDHRITHHFQGNLADICPVGAITNRDWRFRRRAWKLKATESVCTTCATGCNITLDHHQNRIFRVKPRENPEVNRWWICDEGRVDFKRFNTSEDRLTAPQVRTGGVLQTASWDAALAALTQKAKTLGAKGAQVQALTDTQATTEEMHLLLRVLKEGLGGDSVRYPLVQGAPALKPPRKLEDDFLYSLINTDRSPNSAGAKALGLTGEASSDAVKSALGAKVKLLLVLGTPWADNAAVLAAAKGAEFIIHIGTHRGPWSEIAHVVLPGFTAAEKFGTFMNKTGRVQRIQPAIHPPEGARDPVRSLAGVLAALGTPAAYLDGRAVFNSLGQSGAFKGLTWETLGSGGKTLPAAG
ncbi:MAG: 2Fe-2S iron-sulfur cluster-binding protein [Deltaproteobacteria bacterium]|nr:2Fe-2S iron-sulfur cluster-binding protein [Deltaproteobacteria bacterium]